MYIISLLTFQLHFIGQAAKKIKIHLSFYRKSSFLSTYVILMYTKLLPIAIIIIIFYTTILFNLFIKSFTLQLGLTP